MSNETIELISTIVGSKRIAEGAVAYLSMCREMPDEAAVCKALHVTPITAKRICAAAALSGQFLLDTVPVCLNNPARVASYLCDLKPSQELQN